MGSQSELTSWSWRPAALGFAAALALAGCAGNTPRTPAVYQNLDKPEVKIESGVVVEVIGSYRAKYGLAPLSADPALDALAKEQANAMAAKGSTAVSLAKDRQLPVRLNAAGYAYKSASENVSAGYRTIAEAFSGWRESKSHDAVMRHPTATRMGVGTAYAPNSKYKVFWSLIVAEPAE